MASGQTTPTSERFAQRPRRPVDIALDVGMQPMLAKHGFQCRTRRYFVRETPGAVQYVAISPPDRRSGYLNCLYQASAGIISKRITEITKRLDLRNLFMHIKYTKHDCHMECELHDIYRFNARIDFERNIKRSSFFLRPFVKYPNIDNYIPEMKEFEVLCEKINLFPSSPLASMMADTYAHHKAHLYEKYMIPWFDQCEDIRCFVQWIEYWVGRRVKTPNLLLAMAYCLASNFEGARAHFEKAAALADITFEDIYRRELRHQNKMKFCKTTQGQKKRAKNAADLIFASHSQKAEDAQALARYFDIDLS